MGQKRRGFSVIEVILASTLIAMVVIASVNMLPNSSRALRANSEQAGLEHDARNVTEYVRSLGFNTIRDLCVDFGRTQLGGVPTTVNCNLVARVVDGQVQIIDSAEIGDGAFALDASFWALDPESGALIPVSSDDDLYAVGGATITKVAVSVAEGTTLYEIMMSQEDSADESNYEIIVKGRVTDDLGTPVADATVYLTSVDGDIPVERTLFSDAEGYFGTRVPRGRYTVAVEKEHYHASPLTSVYIDQSNPFKLNLVLERRISVQGRVRDDAGANLDAINVEFTRQGTGERYLALTDRTGRYETDPIRPGMYEVRAYIDWENHRAETPTVDVERPDVLIIHYNDDTPDGIYDVKVEQLARLDLMRSDQFPTDKVLGWTGSFVLRHASGAQATVTIDNPNQTRLSDYANAINAQASSIARAYVSSGRLFIESVRSGANGRFVWNSSSDPNYILHSLGIVRNNGLNLVKNTTSTTNAEFTVNGTSYTRSKNTGITDVISGVSFDLKATGQASLTVESQRSQGSQRAIISCSDCIGSERVDTQSINIPTSGPITIEWFISAGPRACFFACVDHAARVRVTGPGGFSWSREVGSGQSEQSSTTRTITDAQRGIYNLRAGIASQTHAEVRVSWDHLIQDIKTSNGNILAGTITGTPEPTTYTIRINELAGKEVVTGNSFSTSAQLRWTGTFTINGRNVSITNPDATRLSDYANAINSQAGDRVVASVVNGRLQIKARNLGESLTFSDPDLILLRLGVLRNTGSHSLTTKNLVQSGTDASVLVNGTRITHHENAVATAIPGASITLLKVGQTKVEISRLTFEANPYENHEFALEVRGNPSNHEADPYQQQDISLKRLFVVHGRVKDDRGIDVPGAEVRIEHIATGEVRGPHTDPRARADAVGEFFIPEVPGGQVRITVSRDNGANGWKTHTGVYMINQHTHHRLDFVIPYRASLYGVIKDELGAAVPAATIRLSGGPGGTYTATTDSSGRYRIEEILPGAYDVTVSKEGFDDVVRTRLPIDSFNTEFSIPQFQRLVTYTVRVVDDQGTAISGAIVRLDSMSPTRTSGNTYTFEGIKQGQYTVTVSKSGYQTVSQTVPASSTSKNTVTIQLQPQMIQVTGLVRDSHTSSAISGAEVQLLVRDGSSYVPMSPRRETATNSQGWFTFSNVDPRRAYKLAATAAGYQNAEIIVSNPSSQQTLAMNKIETIVRVDGVEYRSHDRVIRGAIPGVDIIVANPGTQTIRSDHVQYGGSIVFDGRDIGDGESKSETVEVPSGYRLVEYRLTLDTDSGVEYAYLSFISDSLYYDDEYSISGDYQTVTRKTDRSPGRYSANFSSSVSAWSSWVTARGTVEWWLESPEPQNVLPRSMGNNTSVAYGELSDKSKLAKSRFQHTVQVLQVAPAKTYPLYTNGVEHVTFSCSTSGSNARCSKEPSYMQLSGAAGLFRGNRATLRTNINLNNLPEGDWRTIYFEWENTTGSRAKFTASTSTSGQINNFEYEGTASRRISAITINRNIPSFQLEFEAFVSGNNNNMEIRIHRVWISE